MHLGQNVANFLASITNNFMKITFPSNIFSTVLAQAFDKEMRENIQYTESALLSSILESGKADIVMLPTLDLLKHHNCFVSSRFGISFEGGISHSYIYFSESEKSIKDITLAGDFSSVEAILAKILFHELYDQSITVSISPSKIIDGTKNIMLAGDLNFESDNYSRGLNFADELIEITGHPFVNFVFASNNKDTLLEFEARLEGIEENIYKMVAEPDWGSHLSATTQAFFKENFQHVIYEFDESDQRGIEQTVHLCYYHGIIPEVFDIKFTGYPE